MTEILGGECPNCGYNKMIMRFGERGTLSIDACPRCEFAYGNNGTEELKGYDLWDVLINAMKDRLHGQGYQPSIIGIRRFVENYDMPLSEKKSVFDYSNGLPYEITSDYSKMFSRCKILIEQTEKQNDIITADIIRFILGETNKNPLCSE